MMGIGFPELMIILVIIMIIFGAGKLPEIGSAFGNSIKNFKKSMKEAEEIQEAANLESSAIEEGEVDPDAKPADEGAAEGTAATQETSDK
ncbi:MAG: twin-arginine translocase TatA/TatE family subunit [Nitrospinaceae bacterium]|jgi:sec-independent protein translocase protein TatA|nr:twin-arginine translocase TatA/TatE family subunit [Nitrospinaceae bacterium]MDP6657211.1 twin-arginine translocase TatA/TatE family subunit [Nitrospinaceae bacterium]MDP6711218.1 twin-arginine translocase TatA/TatE family subunit [Nitrospinaceae bacterium]MDP7058427.1 twin-arginine translocase TatA/TatE family subunit [Nitrospinaceae bacterium]